MPTPSDSQAKVTLWRVWWALGLVVAACALGAATGSLLHARSLLPLLIMAIALLVLAVALAAWTGSWWYRARGTWSEPRIEALARSNDIP